MKVCRLPWDFFFPVLAALTRESEFRVADRPIQVPKADRNRFSTKNDADW